MFLKSNKNETEPLSTLWLRKKHIPTNVDVWSGQALPSFCSFEKVIYGAAFNFLLSKTDDDKKKLLPENITIILL